MKSAEEKRQKIKKERIKRLSVFLADAYKLIERGYVKTSLTKMIRAAGYLSDVSLTIMAMKNLDIIKQRGTRNNSMWHWKGLAPVGSVTEELAEKIIVEVRRLKANRNIETASDEKAKGKGLVKIIGSIIEKKNHKVDQDKELRDGLMKVLEHLNEHDDELINPLSAAKKHNVDREAFFGTLITLEAIRPHKNINDHFMWEYGNPDNILLDLIMEAYVTKRNLLKSSRAKKNDVMGGLRAKSLEARAELLLKIFKSVHKLKRGFKGSVVGIMRKKKIAAAYLTQAIKHGYIENIGTNRNPVYKMIIEPTMYLTRGLVTKVRDEWRNHTARGRTERSDVRVVPKENTVDLNAVRDRAIKRKAYLEEELVKCDKIIAATDELVDLGAELLSNN